MKRLIKGIGSIAPVQPSAIPNVTIMFNGLSHVDASGHPRVTGICNRCIHRRRMEYDERNERYYCPRRGGGVAVGGSVSQCDQYDIDMSDAERIARMMGTPDTPRPFNLNLVGRMANCHTCSHAWGIDAITPNAWECPMAQFRGIRGDGPTNCSVYVRDQELYQPAPAEID